MTDTLSSTSPPPTSNQLNPIGTGAPPVDSRPVSASNRAVIGVFGDFDASCSSGSAS